MPVNSDSNASNSKNNKMCVFYVVDLKKSLMMMWGFMSLDVGLTFFLCPSFLLYWYILFAKYIIPH